MTYRDHPRVGPNPAWSDGSHRGESCLNCGVTDCDAKTKGLNVWCTWYHRIGIYGTKDVVPNTEEVGESAVAVED